MASGKALLKKYIKDNHKEEIDMLKSQNKQCKVSIDYENLNQFYYIFLFYICFIMCKKCKLMQY